MDFPEFLMSFLGSFSIGFLNLSLIYLFARNTLRFLTQLNHLIKISINHPLNHNRNSKKSLARFSNQLHLKLVKPFPESSEKKKPVREHFCTLSSRIKIPKKKEEMNKLVAIIKENEKQVLAK